ncbi:MAG: tandem-95 repeat protein [Betaproteobacteria bacterium]
MHTLQSSSPAIDAGGGASDFDALGVERNQIPDIGASENRAASRAKLYWAEQDTDSIWRANTDGSAQQRLVTGLSDPRGVAVDLTNGFVYWSETGTPDAIRRANLDGSEVTSIATTGLHGPLGLALDAAGGRLYYADNGSGNDHIERIDVTGANRTNLFALDSFPSDVALDVGHGYLYAAERNSGQLVSRAIDGSGASTVLFSGAGSGMTNVREIEIDTVDRMLYWVGGDAMNDTIYRGRPDGTGLEMLIGGLDQAHGLALDLAAGRMYWNEYGGSMGSARLDGTDRVSFAIPAGEVRDLDILTLPAVSQAPEGADKTVTTAEDTPATLKPADFGFFDSDGQAFAGVVITSAPMPSQGILWLGSTKVSDGEFIEVEAIQAGKLVFVPAANANGSNAASFKFQVSDGGPELDPTPNTLSFDITPVDDAPTLTLSTAGSSWVEGQSPVMLDAALTLGDVDHTLLGGASVAIAGGFTAGDRLHVTPPVGVIAGYNHNTGVLTLTGQATLADYQAALRSVAFSSDSEHPTSAGTTRTVSWTVSDGALGSPVQTSTVSVTGVNDAPSGADKTIALLEDTPHTVTVADFGFSDVDDGLFTGVYIASPPGAGNVLALDGTTVSAGQWISAAQIADGKLRFTPAANANGPNLASFTFGVQDDGGMANGGVDTDATPNRLSFDVTAVNDAPTVTPFADLLLNEDFSTRTISFTVGDVESGAASLTVTAESSDTSIVQPPTLSGASADRTIRLQSMAHAFGTATVTVTVSDGVNSTSASFAVQVSPLNDAPQVVGTSATLAAVAEDTPSPAGRLISDLLAANYSDARDGIYATPMAGVAVVGIEGSDERGSWQYSAGGSTGWTSMPGSGLSETSAVILPSTYWLRFLPAPDFNGDPGALRLRLADGSQGAIALPTVQSLSGNWGGTKVWSASSVFLKTDVVAANDRPEALGPATLPAIDEDTASPPGVRVDELFAGSYTDAADADQWSDLAGVAIVGNAATAAQGRWQHSANGTDGWTAIRASGLSDEAALVLPASHWLRFVPSANWAGTPGELSVRLADGSQGAVGLGTAVNLTDGLGETGIWSDDLVPLGTEVTPVNDAPVAADDTRTIAEDGMLNDSVAGLVTDVDGSSFTYAIVGETPAGLVFDAATGNYTYTPAANFHGALSFQYKASDGVADSNVATVSINVTPVNDAPVIELPPVLQARANSPLQLMREAGLRITDVDATSFTVTLATTGGVPIRLVPDSLDDLVSHSGNGTDTVTIEGTKINVNRAVNGMVLDMGASGLIGLTVTVSDNGGAGVGGPLIATASSLIDVTPGAMPQVTTTAGPVTFTEDDPGLVVDPGLTVTDSDSAQLTQARVTIMLGFRAGDLLQATSLPGGITQSWDEASRVLTLSGTTSVANYQAALRSVSFSNSSQSPSTATRTLAFVVDDGKGPSLAATREVKVVAVNDSPTLALPMADQSVAEDSAFTFAVPANTFADVDVGDTFVYTATKADGTALPAWLSFDAATRRFSGMPTNDDVGPVTLRVTATDAAGAQASGSFTLTVVNANDAPTLAAPIAGQTATEGSIFTFAVPANTFGDVDAGDALAYTATQADGTALPAWLRFEAATMGFRGAPQRLDAGPLNIRVTATDRAGQSAAGGFRIDVVALPFVSPAPATPTSPAPVFVTPPPAPAPASASNPVAVPPPAAMPAPAPSPATDPASASLTSGGRAPSPEPATLAPVAAPAPANAAASSDSRAPASGAPGASESPVAAAPAGAKAQASSPDAPSSPAPSGDGAKAAAATPGDAGAAVAKEPAGAVAANAPATAGGPGAPAGQAPPAVSRGANPAADAVAAVGRWVAGSGLGGLLAAPAPVQPSLSWAPVGQLGLERGAFDSALGLGSSSPGDGTASQRVDNSFRQLREDAQEEAVVEQGVVASSVVVSTGFSVGYVLWLARGGALLASLASAIPAWAMVDPMPVLSKQRPGGRGPHAQGPDPDADNDGMGAPDDEVEDMFDAGSRAGASSTPPPLATPPLPAAATQPAAEARP